MLAFTDNLNPNCSDLRLIPIGGGFVKIVLTAGLPLTIYLQDYYNVVNPELAPDWQLRFQVALLFSKLERPEGMTSYV